jgi:hypothetical protein
MCRWPIRLLAITVCVLAAAVAEARASIDWTYDTLSSTSQVLSDNSKSSISFTPQAPISAAGTSDIVLVNLNAHSTTADDSPDAISNGKYILVLHLTDAASKQSTNLAFTGDITGKVSAHSTITSNTFTGPTTESAMLGAYTYTVTVGPYVGPGPIGAIPGSIGAEVMVEPGCHQTGEPSGLILASLGLGCLGLVIWRRQNC